MDNQMVVHRCPRPALCDHRGRRAALAGARRTSHALAVALVKMERPAPFRRKMRGSSTVERTEPQPEGAGHAQCCPSPRRRLSRDGRPQGLHLSGDPQSRPVRTGPRRTVMAPGDRWALCVPLRRSLPATPAVGRPPRPLPGPQSRITPSPPTIPPPSRPATRRWPSYRSDRTAPNPPETTPSAPAPNPGTEPELIVAPALTARAQVVDDEVSRGWRGNRARSRLPS
jgi:hypothetical protein